MSAPMKDDVHLLGEVTRLERELARLERECSKACEARAKLPPGTSRARVTTANARWAAKAECRETVRRMLEEAKDASGCGL